MATSLEGKLNTYIYIYLTPLHEQDMTQGQVFKQNLTGFISEFSFSESGYHTKIKEPNLPYYLPIAGGRIVGFIPFLRVLALREKPTASFRIWTLFTMSISYDNNQ